MNRKSIKIYDSCNFNQITKGIKVAQCMQVKSSISETERIVNNLEDLTISDSLSCSFCKTVFKNKVDQRLHYKLDWHRFNLKQRLHGFESISENCFNLMVDKNGFSYVCESECEFENKNIDVLERRGVIIKYSKNKSVNGLSDGEINKLCIKSKNLQLKSGSSDRNSINEDFENTRDNILLSIATRHSKVFFENEEGTIFSIYRCLLHSKKAFPESENQIIAQALDIGKKTVWTIIMVGGGHFAGAVFSGGNPLVHKTFHAYTVRSRQGVMQTARDNRNISTHLKSAGANIRRNNEASLTQHVQDILMSWSSHIMNSSLILYRAVGPYNRTMLFGGKNSPIDKNDPRLRALPFPTRRATFNEVKRVYDVLSNMEIYGSGNNFMESFSSSSPRRKKKRTAKIMGNTDMSTKYSNKCRSNLIQDSKYLFHNDGKQKRIIQEKQTKGVRIPIDRAKPRKSPERPLPTIVAELARSSSDSGLSRDDNEPPFIHHMDIISQNCSFNFQDRLKLFENTAIKSRKKYRQSKVKIKKAFKEDRHADEEILAVKRKIWKSCLSGDGDMFFNSLEVLLTELRQCDELWNHTHRQKYPKSSDLLSMNDIVHLVNVPNVDGNTMLHLATIGSHLRIAWTLLDLGSDPCHKNNSYQTPYNAASNKNTKNVLRDFLGKNPYKYFWNMMSTSFL